MDDNQPVEQQNRSIAMDQQPASAAAAEDGNKPKQQQGMEVKFTISNIEFLIELSFLAIAGLGQMLLWFQADWSAKNGIPNCSCDSFLALFVSCVLLTVSATSFIPKSCRNSLRTFATFLFLSFIETALCAAAEYMQTEWVDGWKYTPSSKEQYNTMKAGIVLTLMGVFPLFFMSYFVPRTGQPLGEIVNGAKIKNNLMNARFLFWFLAIGSFFLGQVITWSIKKTCNAKYQTNQGLLMTPFLNATPLIISILGLQGMIYDDREALDLVSFVTTRAIICCIRPFFTDDVSPFGQSNFKELWRAEVAFNYIGCIFVILGIIIHSIHRCRASGVPSVVESLPERLKTKQFFIFVFVCIFTLAGAICVFTRSPQPGLKATILTRLEVYYAGVGMLLPFFYLVAWWIRFEGVAWVATVFAFEVAQGCAFFMTGKDGYERGGLLILLWSCFILPAAYYSAGGALQSAEKYFSAENRNLMLVTMGLWFVGAMHWEGNSTLYPIGFFAGTLIFAAASASHKDAGRLAFLIAAHQFSMPKAWPLNYGFDQSSRGVIFALIVAWYCCFHAWTFQGAPFACLHAPEGADGSFSELKNENPKDVALLGDNGANGNPDSTYRPVDVEEHKA